LAEYPSQAFQLSDPRKTQQARGTDINRNEGQFNRCATLDQRQCAMLFIDQITRQRRRGGWKSICYHQ